MDRPELRTNSPTSKKVTDMNALASAAKGYADFLVHQKTRTMNRPDAIRSVANDAGLPPGSVENASRGRLKAKVSFVRDALRDLYIRKLAQEIGRLEHELSIARLASARPDDSEILAAATALQKVRETLDRARV